MLRSPITRSSSLRIRMSSRWRAERQAKGSCGTGMNLFRSRIDVQPLPGNRPDIVGKLLADDADVGVGCIAMTGSDPIIKHAGRSREPEARERCVGLPRTSFDIVALGRGCEYGVDDDRMARIEDALRLVAQALVDVCADLLRIGIFRQGL